MSAFRSGDTRSVSGGRALGNGLVVAEIAVAFTLLVGAGLLVKNLTQLTNRDTGMRTERIISFKVSPSGPRYANADQVVAFYRELYTRLEHVDTIEQVGMTSHLPMVDFGWNGEFLIDGTLPWTANQAPLVEYRWLYGEYLKTMGVPLVKGRLLDSRDGKGTTTVLINQAVADKFWPGQEPVGRRFGQASADRSAWFEVVGVIGNVRSLGLARNTPYEFYRLVDQESFQSMTVVMRTRSSDSSSVMPTVRQVVASIDTTLPISQVQTMDTVLAGSVGQPRLMSALTGLFGVLAGLLAMIGVYGVMAYNVRRQRREFGIRLALGAGASNVRNLVVGRGLGLAAIGVTLGAFGAWLLGGVVSSLLTDMTPTDPAVYAITAALVFAVAAFASYLPARTASRVDPMTVLRDV
jgi:putative ABC transport system permease protein